MFDEVTFVAFLSHRDILYLKSVIAFPDVRLAICHDVQCTYADMCFPVLLPHFLPHNNLLHLFVAIRKW